MIEGSLGYTLNSGQMPYRGYMVLSGLPSIMGVSERSTIEMSWRSSHAASFRTSLLHSVIGRSIRVSIVPHIVVPHGLGLVELEAVLTNLRLLTQRSSNPTCSFIFTFTSSTNIYYFSTLNHPSPASAARITMATSDRHSNGCSHDTIRGGDISSSQHPS